MPDSGKQAIDLAVASLSGPFQVHPDTAVVSASADLAYTYGSLRQKEGEARMHDGRYLHIGRKNDQGQWQIAVESMPLRSIYKDGGSNGDDRFEVVTRFFDGYQHL